MSVALVYPETVSEFLLDTLPYFAAIIGTIIGFNLGWWLLKTPTGQLPTNKMWLLSLIIVVVSILGFMLTYYWVHPDRAGFYPSAVEYFITAILIIMFYQMLWDATSH